MVGPSDTQQILSLQKTVLRAVYDTQTQVAALEKRIPEAPPSVGRLTVTVKTDSFEMEITKMKSLKKNQWFILKLNPKDADQNPKPVENATFFSADEKLLSKTPNKAGTACLFVAKGASADPVEYGADGDADLGKGVVPLTFRDSVVIEDILANDLGAESGDPQDGPIPEDF